MPRLNPRAAVLLVGLLAVGLALAVLIPGLSAGLAEAALDFQRQAQDALAGALRALRSGQPGAVTAFLGLCFLYGFLHALGPGHGKGVIAAYAAAAPVASGRIVLLAGLSSLAQSLTAVIVVYAGIWLVDGARDGVEALAAAIEPLSFGFLALLGLLLARRAWRRLPQQPASAPHHPPEHHHHHHHDHGPAGRCGCGHVHAADPAALAAARSGKETMALIAAVALRPCTSALFLLILTWRLDLDAIGILGALVMGLGTMAVTMSAGLVAGLARRGLLTTLDRGGATLRLVAVAEFLLGIVLFVVAGVTALRLI